MSRTDEIRGKGRERQGTGGGGGAPFVKWGDSYTWLEGKVVGTWEGKYGLSATIDVTNVSEHGLIATGKTEDGQPYTENVRAGAEVNIGLNSATLDGKIEKGDEGKAFHIAFEGWEQPKGGGNRYRIFAVIELTEREDAPGEGMDNPDPQDTTDYSQESDEPLPF
jgi:hypothetical protein